MASTRSSALRAGIWKQARNWIDEEMKKLIVLTMATFAAMMPLMATPDNDNFADASEITGTQGTLNASNVGATSEDGEDTLYDSTATLWFKWTAPTNGNMTIDTFGSDFDTMLGVYTGTGIGDLVEVALNDDADDDIRQSCVYFNAEEGVTYFIMAGGFSDSRDELSRHVPCNVDGGGLAEWCDGDWSRRILRNAA